MSLGYEDREHFEWSDFEGKVINYNDQPGRSFAGIRDLISAAIYRARANMDVNVSLTRATELAARVPYSYNYED